MRSRLPYRLAWLLLIWAALQVFLSDAAALAAPTPSPSATASPSPSPTGTAPSSPAPAAPASPSTGYTPAGDATAPGTGVLGPITNLKVPIDGAGNVPVSRFEITANTGGAMDWDKKLLAFCTNGLFSLTKLIIGVAAWVLAWAFQFGPTKILLDPARQVAQTWQTNVIDRLGLPAFLLTLAGLWCGLLILRGRTSRGWGELGFSVVIAAVAASVLAQPADLLMGNDGVLGKTRDTSMALASITATTGSSDAQQPDKVAQPLQNVLLDTFIAKPHQMLEYGVVMDDKVPAPCRKAYADLVSGKKTQTQSTAGAVLQATSPLADAMGWGAASPAGEAFMRNAGSQCTKYANYAHNPTWDRLFGAVLLLVAAILVAFLVLLMVGVLLVAEIGLAFYAMAGNLVAVIAILPGGSRGLLWRWAGGIAKIVLVIFAVVIALPLLALFLGAIMRSAGGQALIVKFGLMDVTVAGGIVYHRKLIKFSTRAGQRISRRMEMARIGGSRGNGGYGGYGGYGGDGYGYGGYGMGQGWLGYGDPNALSPVSAAGLAYGLRAEIGRVTAPVAKAKHAWTGNAATNRKYATKLRSEGAGGFKQKMYGSRGGRVVWRTAKATGTAGRTARTATAYTLGAPVTWGQAKRSWTGQTAERPGVVAMRGRLDKARAVGQSGMAAAGGKVRGSVDYARRWGEGIAPGVVQAYQDPQIRERVAQARERAGQAAARHVIIPAQMQWDAMRGHPADNAPSGGAEPGPGYSTPAPDNPAQQAFWQRMAEARRRRHEDPPSEGKG